MISWVVAAAAAKLWPQPIFQLGKKPTRRNSIPGRICLVMKYIFSGTRADKRANRLDMIVVAVLAVSVVFVHVWVRFSIRFLEHPHLRLSSCPSRLAPCPRRAASTFSLPGPETFHAAQAPPPTPHLVRGATAPRAPPLRSAPRRHRSVPKNNSKNT